MRAATYHRCSTLEQNPTLAREELRAAAARLSAEIVLDIEETGSGARNDRPGLQRVLEAARKGQIDVVFVWKLDRLGRSVLDLHSNLREFDTAGVRLISVTQGIDIRPGGDSTSRLVFSILASVAEFEREMIRERTRLGLAKARANGVKLGRRKIKLPNGEQVKEHREKGRSWYEIAAMMKCSRYACKMSVGQNY